MLCGCCCTQRGAFLGLGIMNIILAILAIAALGHFDKTVTDILELLFSKSDDDVHERARNTGGVGMGVIIILCTIASATVAFTAFACLNLMPECCACTCADGLRRWY